MARFEFKLPDIGEGIAEAEIVAWHVKVGDTIGEDQQIADMMTDKATVEMESPVAGKVIELAGEVGDQVPIGSVLAVIETEGADRAAEPVDDSKDERPLADGAVEATPEQAKEIPGHGCDDTHARPARPERRVEGLAVERSKREQRLRQAQHERKVEPTSSPPPPSAPAPATSASTLAQVKTAGDRIRHSDLDAYLLYNGGTRFGPRHRRRAHRRDDQGRRPAPQDRREHAGGEAPHPAFHAGRGI